MLDLERQLARVLDQMQEKVRLRKTAKPASSQSGSLSEAARRLAFAGAGASASGARAAYHQISSGAASRRSRRCPREPDLAAMKFAIGLRHRSCRPCYTLKEGAQCAQRPHQRATAIAASLLDASSGCAASNDARIACDSIKHRWHNCRR